MIGDEGFSYAQYCAEELAGLLFTVKPGPRGIRSLRSVLKKIEDFDPGPRLARKVLDQVLVDGRTCVMKALYRGPTLEPLIWKWNRESVMSVTAGYIPKKAFWAWRKVACVRALVGRSPRSERILATFLRW